MGLDMYLTAKQYFFDTETEQYKKLQELSNTPFKAESIEIEVGYWRKSNEIHKWFVDNVQDGTDDCGTYAVSEENIKELLQKVSDALVSKNPENMLPTQSGFFFGGTEYDEWYVKGLESTKEILEKWLKYEGRNKFDLQYHSSW